MKYANLHLHSVYSDSQLTPLQLVLIGKSLGYRAWALTDHETYGGVKEFMKYAADEGIDSLPGVEFYGNLDDVYFHIVALDYDMETPAIRAFIKERCDLRTECTRKCFERGVEMGFIQGATWEDVLDYADEGSWICIDHVIGALRHKRVLPPVGGIRELRQNVFKGPEPKSFSPQHPSVEEVIRVISQAGGIAILAHPNGKIPYVPQLVEMGLNGIEVSHAHLFRDTARQALRAAQQYNLYHSGGTDHTGAMSGCDGVNAVPALQGIDEEEYLTIKERRLG